MERMCICGLNGLEKMSEMTKNVCDIDEWTGEGSMYVEKRVGRQRETYERSGRENNVCAREQSTCKDSIGNLLPP